jgi:hypothetical protein
MIWLDEGAARLTLGLGILKKVTLVQVMLNVYRLFWVDSARLLRPYSDTSCQIDVERAPRLASHGEDFRG